jgi:hypothetical protein
VLKFINLPVLADGLADYCVGQIDFYDAYVSRYLYKYTNYFEICQEKF